ncbi:MAG: hypothetical protein FJ207_00780 [Gemmatimonadetes bacterium]|nr:hypothetical protein [Gemmatimonadota bacterium]
MSEGEEGLPSTKTPTPVPPEAPAARDEAAPRSDVAPRGAPTPPPGGPVCDLCGHPMRESHCKLICDQCGYTRDCSDP